jgi:hypothetical protein
MQLVGRAGTRVPSLASIPTTATTTAQRPEGAT